MLNSYTGLPSFYIDIENSSQFVTEDYVYHIYFEDGISIYFIVKPGDSLKNISSAIYESYLDQSKSYGMNDK